MRAILTFLLLFILIGAALGAVAAQVVAPLIGVTAIHIGPWTVRTDLAVGVAGAVLATFLLSALLLWAAKDQPGLPKEFLWWHLND